MSQETMVQLCGAFGAVTAAICAWIFTKVVTTLDDNRGLHASATVAVGVAAAWIGWSRYGEFGPLAVVVAGPLYFLIVKMDEIVDRAEPRVGENSPEAKGESDFQGLCAFLAAIPTVYAATAMAHALGPVAGIAIAGFGGMIMAMAAPGAIYFVLLTCLLVFDIGIGGLFRKLDRIADRLRDLLNNA